MLVAFLRDFDWTPPERRGRASIAYKSGMILFVRRKCAEEAIAAGAAKPITKETTNVLKHR